MAELALVTLASLLAGCVDAIVGGGGLILVPALFAAYPGAAPATLFGTNKGGAIWGTAFAAWRFLRRVELRWCTWLPACACALTGSAAGAWAVTQIDARPLRIALPLVLLALLAYTLARKELGRAHAPRHGAAPGGAVGRRHRAGDRFLRRPVRPRHRQLLRVPVRAPARLRLPARQRRRQADEHLHQRRRADPVRRHRPCLVGGGSCCWRVANIAGSFIGTHLALSRGAGFVRGAFIVRGGLADRSRPGTTPRSLLG
jgi:hypothetical protein